MSDKNPVHMGRHNKVDKLVREWDYSVSNLREENRRKYNSRF